MKNLTKFFAMALVLYTMASCSEDPVQKQDPLAEDANLLSLKSTLPTNLCGSFIFPTLWAGQTIDAGDVTVANDGSNLYITVCSVNGFQNVNENIKIWVGTTFDFTQRPAAGQFPYKYTAPVEPGCFTTTAIPLSEIEGYTGTVCPGQKLYIIVHADVLANNGGVITPETAFGGGWVGPGTAWWYYIKYTPYCCENPVTCTTETAWAAGSRYVARGNWATYTAYAGAAKIVTLFAGQTMNAGQVAFSAASGGNVTITITLNPGWSLAEYENSGNPIPEAVKIQGYSSAPSGNPAPGLFTTYKGNELVVTVPVSNFYGVHIDVQQCK
jgi:hypothetical protein